MASKALISAKFIPFRSAPGRSEMMRSNSELDPLDRRLLSLANGFTDLGTLASLLNVEQLTPSVHRLIEAGLLLNAKDHDQRMVLWRPDQTRNWDIH